MDSATTIFTELLPEFSGATIVTIGNSAPIAHRDREYRAIGMGQQTDDVWHVQKKHDWKVFAPKDTTCLHC